MVVAAVEGMVGVMAAEMVGVIMAARVQKAKGGGGYGVVGFAGGEKVVVGNGGGVLGGATAVGVSARATSSRRPQQATRPVIWGSER